MIHANEELQAGDYTDYEANQMSEIELEMYREAVEEAEAALGEVNSVVDTGTAKHPYLSQTAEYAYVSLFCIHAVPVTMNHSKGSRQTSLVAPEIYSAINEAGLDLVDVSPIIDNGWDEVQEEEYEENSLMLWCSLSR